METLGFLVTAISVTFHVICQVELSSLITRILLQCKHFKRLQNHQRCQQILLAPPVVLFPVSTHNFKDLDPCNYGREELLK